MFDFIPKLSHARFPQLRTSIIDAATQVGVSAHYCGDQRWRVCIYGTESDFLKDSAPLRVEL